ncbi:hypothetical protein YSY43_37930 [Paenibacillus sp. YSY-4.3]
MISIITIFGSFILALLLFTLIDFSNFKWVHLNLRRPSNKFIKGLSTSKIEFTLSTTNKRFLQYYYGFNLSSLKDLETEISIKRTRYTENNQFSNYLSNLLTLFSLLIAVFAITSSLYPADNVPDMVFFTMIFIVIILGYFIADLTIKTFNANLMDRHLFAIRRTIDKKEAFIKKDRRPRNIK